MKINFLDEDYRDNIEIGINYFYKEVKKKNPNLFFFINENIIVLVDIFHFYFDNLKCDMDKFKSSNHIFLGLIDKKFTNHNKIDIYINNVKLEKFLLPDIKGNNEGKILTVLPIIFSQILKRVLHTKNNKIKYLLNILKSKGIVNNKIIADQLDIGNKIGPVDYNLTMNMIIYQGFFYNIDNNIFINKDNFEILYILGLNGTLAHFSNLFFDLLQFDTDIEKLLNTPSCNIFYYILFKKLSKNKNKNKNILTYFFGISEKSFNKDDSKDMSKITSMREMFQYFSNIFEKIVSNNNKKEKKIEIDYTLKYKIFKKKKFKEKGKKKLFLKLFYHYIEILISDTFKFFYNNKEICDYILTIRDIVEKINVDLKKSGTKSIDNLKLIKKYYFNL